MAEYLDRDDVLNVIDYIRTKYISVYNRRDKCSQFWADTIRYFEKQINNLDDYDVEPVRHGYWIAMGDCGVTKCSCCGWSIEECIEDKYCRECGAKMDGKK